MRLTRSNLPGPLIVAAAGAIMCVWSWDTWPDVVLDFGRELYVPWQITEGKVLYRDIVSYFNGPLSPYLHALLFKVFGVGLSTLVWFNLLVIVALVSMLYWLLNRAWGTLAAVAGGVSFFVIFAFAQYRIAGNYNYVTPYSYELTHGITLTLAALVGLVRFGDSRELRWVVMSGVMLGLVFLTKAEIFFAAAASIGIGVLLLKPTGKGLAGFAVGLVMPPSLAFLLLMTHLTPVQALRGLAGSWRWLGDNGLLGLPFFRELAGTDNIARSVTTIVTCAGVYALLFGVPALVGMKLKAPRAVSAIIFILVAGIGIAFWNEIPWPDEIRAMPLLLLIVAIALFKRRSEHVLPLVLVVWSLAMLAKIPLNARVYHYGFALAMPATIVGIAVLIGWLPDQIDRAKGNGLLLRTVVAATLIVMLYAHARMQAMHWAPKTVVVGTGPDHFWSDDRAIVVNQALSELARMASPTSTLAVVPEGLIINYLGRLENPTGQLNFTPPAILMYGESEMLRAYKDHPPDFLILTGVVTDEYGARFFGEDYARELGQWMQENYVIVRTIGPRPFRDPGFGLVLFRRSR